MKTKLVVAGLGLALFCAVPVFAQNPPSETISVNSSLVTDAAGPEQRKSLNSIYLIVCPNVDAGSGFLVSTGFIVTNSHVVASCTEQNLIGISSGNNRIKFSHIIRDTNRDLAILVPSEKLAGGLRIALKDNPEPGTTVSTWGYPFLYNGATPLLSVGYVSGYRADTSSGRSVNHIVVNGAFNHGNSGGPLLISHDNQVIGIVVLTFHFYPAEVKQVIDKLMSENWGVMYGYRNPDGSEGSVSEARLTAMVLNEFYQKTQVMIGEAVAATELSAMIREHSGELPVVEPARSGIQPSNSK